MTVIAGAIKVAQTVYKYRKYIYRTLVAQDKAIGFGWKTGGYSKWTSAGIRHGALAGSVIGTLLSNQAEDTPGNGIQTPFKKQQYAPSKSYQTRSRYTKRERCWNPSQRKNYAFSRYPSSR